MRLLFKRCHGENPKSCGAAELGEPGEFVVSEFFISEACKIRLIRVNPSTQLVCQRAGRHLTKLARGEERLCESPNSPLKSGSRREFQLRFPVLPTVSTNSPLKSGSRRELALRACFEMRRGPAAGDFGGGPGGEFRASPQRAVRNEPTRASAKRAAARRAFTAKAAGFVAPRSQPPAGMLPRRASPAALGAKTGRLRILKQALRTWFRNRPGRGPGLQGPRILPISCRPRALTRHPLTILKQALMVAVSCAIASGGHLFAGAKPISLHPENPHYLLWRGKPAALVSSGEHYGAVMNAPFDYIAYLDEIHSLGLNKTRVFSGLYCEAPGDYGIKENKNVLAPDRGNLLCPYARSDTPGY